MGDLTTRGMTRFSHKFSKVNTLLNFLCKFTTEPTFDKIYLQYGQRDNAEHDEIFTKILKSQHATQLPMWIHYKADFWEDLPAIWATWQRGAWRDSPDRRAPIAPTGLRCNTNVKRDVFTWKREVYIRKRDMYVWGKRCDDVFKISDMSKEMCTHERETSM